MNQLQDQHRLISEFGLSSFSQLLAQIPDPHPLMRRGIIFAHRGYELILECIRSGSEFSVLSGFMPSGPVHLGHLLVMQEIIWHQRKGAHAYVPIADLESLIFREIPLDQARKIALDYILSLIASGFSPKGQIYFQSQNPKLHQLAAELGTKVTLSEIFDIYGFQPSNHVSMSFYPLIDAADILYPQLDGPIPTVIPVGIDQDPHIRLARDLATRFRIFQLEQRSDHLRISLKHPAQKLLSQLAEALAELGIGGIEQHQLHLELREAELRQLDRFLIQFESRLGYHGFHPPAAIYHKLIPGLSGGKMSSSIPGSFIALTDSPESAQAKIWDALTGGRKSSQDQRRYGGNPQSCTIFQLFSFMLIQSDAELAQIQQECIQGGRLCGECKQLASQLMGDFLKQHSELRSQARDELQEYGIKLG